jgi:ketosteroid isomerase-like protein
MNESLLSQNSTETTREVVTAYVRALQRGDLDALRASFVPAATWTLRGGMPVSGTWTGADGILDGFLAQVVARLDPNAPVTQDLHRVIADGEYAVAEWTSHARAWDGRAYDNDYAVVFHVVDGLIAEVTEYFDTAYMKAVLFTERGDRSRADSTS